MLRQNSLGREEGATRSRYAVTFFIGPKLPLPKLGLPQNNKSGINRVQSEPLLDMTGFVVVVDYGLKHDLNTSLTVRLLLFFDPEISRNLSPCSDVAAQHHHDRTYHMRKTSRRSR